MSELDADRQDYDAETPFFTSLLIDSFHKHFRLPSGGCNCQAEICLMGPWVERELRKQNIVPIYRSTDEAA